MISIQFQVNQTTATGVYSFSHQRVPELRRTIVSRLFEDAMTEIVARTPVRTGRLRRGWLAAAGRGTGEGEILSLEAEPVSSITAINRVPYAVYLEYGTSRMAPRLIARRALANLVSSGP